MNKKKIIIICIVALIIFFCMHIKTDERIYDEIALNNTAEINEHQKIYLAIGEYYQLDNLTYASDNDIVAMVIGDKVKGISVGTVTLRGKDNYYEVEVTDMIVAPAINDNKEEIPCGKYTQEDNEYLDLVLKTKIMDKGYHTRAGVVEAARFLLLQFPYKLHYFMENGRLPYCDGEGRYYHEGLYLNIYKVEKENITKHRTGPAPWGCFIFNGTTEYNQRNSLDCSGFVTWVLKNGGFDPGDIGAGPVGNVLDCSDLGENHPITYESLDEVRVGDIFAEDGHTSILIGINNGIYYIAESNTYINVRVYGWTKDELVHSKFFAWVDMDEFYEHADGKLSNYWE